MDNLAGRSRPTKPWLQRSVKARIIEDAASVSSDELNGAAPVAPSVQIGTRIAVWEYRGCGASVFSHPFMYRSSPENFTQQSLFKLNINDAFLMPVSSISLMAWRAAACGVNLTRPVVDLRCTSWMLLFTEWVRLSASQRILGSEIILTAQ